MARNLMALTAFVFCVLGWTLLAAAQPAGGRGSLRAPLVMTDSQRQQIVAALADRHAQYDPQERMLRRPFSSPGYHTTLKGGFVHSTRDSLVYAVALLDTGDDALRVRAQEILARVIALQDQNPANKTYGIWSWFMEEPLDKMSPPDWNWADFCGHSLLQVAMDHRQRIPKELLASVDQSIIHAARSIQRRNVAPGYTNIAILGTYVTMVAAEMYDLPDLRQYAADRLKKLYEYTDEQNAFSEYNSPTYTIVSLKALAQLRQDIKVPAAIPLIDDLHRRAWEEMASHFHVATRQWAGPHSRCYQTLLRPSVLAIIQRGTANRVNFALPPAITDPEECRISLSCPSELEPLFTDAGQPRLLVRPLAKAQPPIVGSTYLHPKFTIASVSRGDLWNQRRALLAYWGTADKPAYLHLRFLHDGYDFSAAQFFSTQSGGSVLAGINFATDGGDTHVSLDRIKDQTIRASDLRMRIELGGSAAQTPLPSAPTRLGDPIQLRFGDMRLYVAVPFAQWGNGQGKWEVSTEKDTLCLDVVLHHGQPTTIRLSDLSAAALAVGVSLGDDDTKSLALTAGLDAGRLLGRWGDMSLDIAAHPDKAGALQKSGRAAIFK